MVAITSPAPGRPVTSPFGWRINPITGKRALHHGIDYGGQFTVILAGRAKIVSIGYDRYGLGNYVIAEHAPGFRTAYGHGAHRSQLVKGRTYADNMPVFTSGTTGASTGNHLHFEVRIRNRWGVWVRVDPTPYFVSTTPTDKTLERRKRTWLG